LKEVAEA